MVSNFKNAIQNKDLDKIFIGGEEFVGIGYQGLMTVNTKTYVEQPGRTNDGSMPNINDHDTFFVPRCKVNFKYFNIRDYQRLCRVVNSANEFPVSYFDKQFGEFRTYMMYVEPEEMSKMYNVGTYVFGLLDYEVSFIGTLNDLEKYTVKYITNNLTKRIIAEYDSSAVYSQNSIVKVTNGESVKYYKYKNEISTSGNSVTDTNYWEQIYNNIDKIDTVKWGNVINILPYSDLSNFYEIPYGKIIKGWNTLENGTGFNILPNSRWSVFENTNIYPIFEDKVV